MDVTTDVSPDVSPDDKIAPATALAAAAAALSLDPTSPPLPIDSTISFPSVNSHSHPETPIPLDTPIAPTCLSIRTYCQDTLGTDMVCLVPCLHKFHFSCAAQLLKCDSRKRNQCVNCAAKIQSVTWDLQGPPTVSKHYVLGSSTEDSGPFIRDDETVHPGTTPEEKERILTLRRLRQKAVYEPGPKGIDWGHATIFENNRWISVTRTTELAVYQSFRVGEIYTMYEVNHQLTLSTFALDEDPGPDPASIPQAIATVTKARTEIRKILKTLGPKKLTTSYAVDEAEAWIPCDEKGLSARASKRILVKRPKQGLEDIRIELIVTLWEDFPEKEIKHSLEGEGEEVVEGLNLEEREKAVKAARIEIASLFEHARLFRGETGRIDKACTGVFEPLTWGEWECGYCEEKHRHGDCMLPWKDDETI